MENRKKKRNTKLTSGKDVTLNKQVVHNRNNKKKITQMQTHVATAKSKEKEEENQ